MSRQAACCGRPSTRTSSHPGEPAIINSWHKVRAEFKDGKVTGTLTTSHLQWDVVNGQQVNPRTISVTVEFEGVKQK
jgi:hypothetical protein